MRSRKNLKPTQARAELVISLSLLSIRQQREQKLRRQIMQNRRQQATLQARIENVRRQRSLINEQLRQLTQWCGMLHPGEFIAQKKQLHLLYQKEQAQQTEIKALLEQIEQVEAVVKQLQFSLQGNLMKQEKLRILIENEANRY